MIYSSYNTLLVAGDGTAAVVLVEHGVQKAKELQVIGQLSWLHMCAVMRLQSLFLLCVVAGTCCTGTMRRRFCRSCGKVRVFVAECLTDAIVGMRLIVFVIFALLFSLHRRCPVLAWRGFAAASAGLSLRRRSYGRRSR
jgi:hypothetical protein